MPDWTVVWQDELKLHEALRETGLKAPRRLFEFEVLPDGNLGEPPDAD